MRLGRKFVSFGNRLAPIFRILKKRSPTDNIRSAPRCGHCKPFAPNFCGSLWVLPGGGLYKKNWAKQYIKTFNSELKRRIMCCEELRHQEFHLSSEAGRPGSSTSQQGLISKSSAQPSEWCYRTDFAGDASGEQAMQLASRTCDPKSVFRAISTKKRYHAVANYWVSAHYSLPCVRCQSTRWKQPPELRHVQWNFALWQGRTSISPSVAWLYIAVPVNLRLQRLRVRWSKCHGSKPYTNIWAECCVGSFASQRHRIKSLRPSTAASHKHKQTLLNSRVCLDISFDFVWCRHLYTLNLTKLASLFADGKNCGRLYDSGSVFATTPCWYGPKRANYSIGV